MAGVVPGSTGAVGPAPPSWSLPSPRLASIGMNVDEPPSASEPADASAAVPPAPLSLRDNADPALVWALHAPRPIATTHAVHSNPTIPRFATRTSSLSMVTPLTPKLRPPSYLIYFDAQTISNTPIFLSHMRFKRWGARVPTP